MFLITKLIRTHERKLSGHCSMAVILQSCFKKLFELKGKKSSNEAMNALWWLHEQEPWSDSLSSFVFVRVFILLCLSHGLSYILAHSPPSEYFISLILLLLIIRFLCLLINLGCYYPAALGDQEISAGPNRWKIPWFHNQAARGCQLLKVSAELSKRLMGWWLIIRRRVSLMCWCRRLHVCYWAVEAVSRIMTDTRA